MWAKMAKASLVKIAEGDTSGFYEAKLSTGRFFNKRLLPTYEGLTTSVKNGADVLFELDEESFIF